MISVGVRAFENCSSLTSVTVPASVKSLSNNVFSNCSALTNVVLEEGLTEVDNRAFYRCISLKNITIPSTVKEIRPDAFLECDSLTSIYFQDPAGWSMGDDENGYTPVSPSDLSDPAKAVELLQKENPESPSVMDYGYKFIKEN